MKKNFYQNKVNLVTNQRLIYFFNFGTSKISAKYKKFESLPCNIYIVRKLQNNF